jgi:uncharacterized protein (DUF4415 family)
MLRWPRGAAAENHYFVVTTKENFGEFKPTSEFFSPDELASLAHARRTRGPQKAPTKARISLRLDRRVLDHFKAEGPGWQSRINEALLKTME